MITPSQDYKAVFLLVSNEDLRTPIDNATGIVVSFLVTATGQWHPIETVDRHGRGWYSVVIPGEHLKNPNGQVVLVATADGAAEWRDILHYDKPVMVDIPEIEIPPFPTKFQVLGTWAGMALVPDEGNGGDSGDGTGDPTDPPTGGGGNQILLGPDILAGKGWTFHDRDQGGSLVQDGTTLSVTLGDTVDQGAVQLYTTVAGLEAGEYRIAVRGEGAGGPLLLDVIQHRSPYGSLAVAPTAHALPVDMDGAAYELVGHYKAEEQARIRIVFPAYAVQPGEWYDIRQLEMRKVIESA